MIWGSPSVTAKPRSRGFKNRRAPDLTTLVALFIPALQLEDEPETVARLLELAAESRGETLAGRSVTIEHVRSTEHQTETWALEPIPLAPPGAIARPEALERIRAGLARDRGVVVCGLPRLKAKTTLAAEVARTGAAEHPVAWLTVTPGVNDSGAALLRFLASVLLNLGQASMTALLEPPRDAPALPADQAVAMIAAAARACGSLLICIDNAHQLQADPAALPLLRQVWLNAPLRLLLVSRFELPLGDVPQIWLGGLARAEGRALARELCPELAPDLVDALVERVDGSPILVRLAAACAGSAMARGGSSSAWPLSRRSAPSCWNASSISSHRTRARWPSCLRSYVARPTCLTPAWWS